jgi:nucleoside phosphorylase
MNKADGTLRMTDQSRKSVESVIITALHEELEAVLEISPSISEGWERKEDDQGFPYHLAEFQATRGSPLPLVAAWAGSMGETAAAERSSSLIRFLQPRSISMCGICAGRRGKVFLGDVIVAERVFSYDHGKILFHMENGIPKEEMLRDIKTYNLTRIWNYNANYFRRQSHWCKSLLPSRPLSLEFQRNWVLRMLFNGFALPPGDERTRFCPRWKEVIGSLIERKFVRIVDGSLKLTSKGKQIASKDALFSPDGPVSDPSFQVHVGPIATGKTVRQDPKIFDRIAQFEREVLGLEMEGAAIGLVADASGIPSIVVKSVTDYGDLDKDDSFRQFSCRAAANFLVAFLKEHPPSSLHNSTRHSSNVQWVVEDVHDRVNSISKSQEAIEHKIEDMVEMLKGISPNMPNISVGQLETVRGQHRIAINIPVDLKGSEVDQRLRSALGTDVHVRYLHGLRVDAPGEAARNTGFAGDRIRPLHLGLRIQRIETSEGYGEIGTLGPFIQLPNGEPGFLSTGHFFRQIDKTARQAKAEMAIVQSSGLIEGDKDEDVIGFSYDLGLPLDITSLNNIDIGSARLRYGVSFLGNVVPVGYGFPYEGETIKPMGATQEVELLDLFQAPVFKIGGTSGWTTGAITAIKVHNVKVHLDDGPYIFNDLIEISAQEEVDFVEQGDSGAPVYTRIKDQLFCIGIFFAAGRHQEGRKDRQVCYCIPIWNALSIHENVKWIDWAVM